MECTLWREMASDYIEGALPPAMADAMRTHISTCAACRSDADALRAVWHAMNVLPTVDPPLFFRENVIAAIERQEAGRPVGPWWRNVLPQLGKVALGTALTGGAVAAAAWMLLLPYASNTNSGDSSHTEAGVVTPSVIAGTPLSSLLPGVGGSNGAASGDAATLKIARVMSMVPGSDGPSYDFSFWLENAQKGTARWHFVGDKTAYRFTLSSGAAQTVRIPYSAAQGRDSLALYVHWTADTDAAATHSRYLLLPVPNGSDRTPTERQSFVLPEESLIDAARDIAVRYGTPVTVDDVPGETIVHISAHEESADNALRESLSNLHLKVTASHAGILIQSDSKTPADPATGSDTAVVR